MSAGSAVRGNRVNNSGMRTLVGTSAVIAPALHSLTDVLEALGGGFSVPQLGLNYVAFVAMPFIVLGLYAMQRPRMGWLGLSGALTYGAAFVYFAGTTAYALARGTPDYATLLRELGGLYIAHGVLMVAGGIIFGAAVIRARVLPPWTGFALIAGVSLNLLVAVLPAPPIVQTVGSAVRNVAFIGMGVALLRPLPPSRRAA
jgi:hypothetical protein